MLFEKATVNDINSLVELRTEYLLEDYGEIPQDKLSLISHNLPPYFNSHLNNDLFAFVCRDDDIIAGCCFLYVSEKPSNPSFINGKTGTVMNVYTRPQYRRKGIGTQLIRAMEKQAAEMGVNTIRLDTFSWQGKEFYEALGYKAVGYYDNAEDGYSEYFFLKRIN